MNFIISFLLLSSSPGSYLTGSQGNVQLTANPENSPSNSAWLIIKDPTQPANVFIVNGNMEYLSMNANGVLGLASGAHAGNAYRWVYEIDPQDTSRIYLRGVASGKYLDHDNGLAQVKPDRNSCHGWGVSVNTIYPIQ